MESAQLKELTEILIEWINNELANHRIIVQNITEDLYDGQVLQKLFEKLTQKKLDIPEVTQSEEGQRQKLAVVLRAVNRVIIKHFFSVILYHIHDKQTFFCMVIDLLTGKNKFNSYLLC